MIDKLKEAIAHNEESHKILEGILGQLEEEKEDKKVTLKVKVVNPFDGVEIDEKELEQIRKDLEEIINDFTRK